MDMLAVTTRFPLLSSRTVCIEVFNHLTTLKQTFRKCSTAYINHGDYNIFLVDWGVLCQPPCYVAAVHNLKPVARCVAQYFTFLRHSGMLVSRTTCVGHSLGAHLCGLMSNYLDFRIERIIGLDPARPLIKPGGVNRLDIGDAKAVQVIHTNAGHYGEGGKLGHVDFCMNGGRKQPYCDNTSSKQGFNGLIRATP